MEHHTEAKILANWQT